METIINKKHQREDVFTVVDTFPVGYTVWNIGRKNFPFTGYIPLARMKDNNNVDLETLKTIKIDSEDLAMRIIDAAAERRVERSDFYNIICSI